MNLQKRIILTLLILLAIPVCAAGQGTANATGFPDPVKSGQDEPGGPANLINVSTYPFSVQSGIGLEDMSTGTTQLVAPGTDNVNSPLADIGFLFRFDNVNFTTFGVHGNGALVLGKVWTGQNTANQINFGNDAKLMPYWDDLCVGNSGKVHYKTVGAPGSRKMIVEWLNMKIARGAQACNGTGGVGTFQLWIFENSGVVQFVYGNGMTQIETSGGYTVGIHSGANTNFAAVTTSSATVSYSAANDIQIAPITAGTSYIFTPPVPAAPTGGNVTNLTQTTLRLNWTDNAANETGYLVRRSDDGGINYSIRGIYPANTTSADDAGLTPSTQYFYLVNAMTDGAFSTGLALSATTNPPRNINSTTTGGLWSAPSTWVGGIIPEWGDNVTIVGGATVIIDTTALAGSLTIGGTGSLAGSKEAIAEGAVPATLRFGETATFTLSVVGDVTIGANDSFTTGGGNANQHILYVGGDLTNNGTLDFSTNNNQAGATIAFNGPGDSAFSGTGAVTDVFFIILNKPSTATVELTTTNFTAGGSSNDGPGTSYLVLVTGTFKISGSFAGTYRTFPSGGYTIPSGSGLWLNNPNYTVSGQHGFADARGNLRLTAGTYNVGTNLDDSIRLREGSNTVIEGGSLNIAAMLVQLSNGSLPVIYNQTGGTVTICTTGSTSSGGCFDLGTHGVGLVSSTISGGKVVIQNPAQVPRSTDFVCSGTCFPNTDATVQFGNAATTQPGIFIGTGPFPNLVINTAGGGHILQMPVGIGTPSAHTVDIGPGGTFDIGGSFSLTGETFINNGLVKGQSNSFGLTFFGANTVMSGTGGTLGALGAIEMRGQSMTFNTGSTFRVRNIRLWSGNLLNANRVTLGNNDSTGSSVVIGNPDLPGPAGHFDSAPIFDLGTGGQSIWYVHCGPSRTTGPEINPGRGLSGFTFTGNNPTDDLIISGGELVINALDLQRGRVIAMGSNDILHFGQLQSFGGSGYVYGTLIRKFTFDELYHFPIGITGRRNLSVNAVLTTNPAYLAVTPVPGPLPGLLPATSLQQQWEMSVFGIINASIGFNYDQANVRGNEADYKIWRRPPGGPTFQVPSNPPSVPGDFISISGTTSDFNGTWGIGAQLDPGPVSVSGTVTTSGGQPIANATLTISGGNLPAPVTTQTGSFGTYQFSNLLAGETYTVRVDAKRYRFTPATQQVTPFADVGNVNFTANQQE